MSIHANSAGSRASTWTCRSMLTTRAAVGFRATIASISSSQEFVLNLNRRRTEGREHRGSCQGFGQPHAMHVTDIPCESAFGHCGPPMWDWCRGSRVLSQHELGFLTSPAPSGCNTVWKSGSNQYYQSSTHTLSRAPTSISSSTRLLHQQAI